MITSLDQLRPGSRTLVEAYLTRATAGIEPDLRDAVADDLRSYLLDRLDADATDAEVADLLAEAGAEAPTPAGARAHPLAGFRLAGADTRVAANWWNPADPRLFGPRALGWGWDLNLGAVAVRLGLIEPDAEAVPFESTRPRAFVQAAALPVALAAAVVAHYVVRGPGLPDRLPDHWAMDGTPDRWVSKRRAATTDLAGALLPAGLAAWASRSSRTGPARAGSLAVATMAASVAAFTTVWRSLGDRRLPWAGPAMIVSSMGAVGAVLLHLARDGRAAEVARDLGEPS